MKLSCVLASVLAAAVAAQDVLVSLPIDLGNGATKDLHLHRGESAERAALSFMELNGLIENGVESERSKQVIAQLAGLLRERTPKEVRITVPLTVDGAVTDLVMYKHEEAADAVARFLRESTLAEDTKLQAHPQLMQLLAQKIQDEQLAEQAQDQAQAQAQAQTQAQAQVQEQAQAQTQTQIKPLFAFDITIDGQASVVEHFDGNDPMVEARAFARRLQITDEAFLERLLPQVANEIQKRIDAVPAPQELFSLPLTVNNQNALLVHYAGNTPAASAMALLQKYGLVDQASIDNYLPALVDMIDRELAARATPKREPLFSVPVTIGDTQQACSYFEGDSPDVTAQLFMETHGLTNNPNYAAFVQQLATLLRQNIQEQMQARAAASASDAKPLFNVPLNLGGTEFELAYYADQDPAVVASEFCAAKMDLLAQGMGRPVNPEEMQQCKLVLFQTISGILDKLEAKVVDEPAPVAPEAPAPTLLFSLDIDLGDGKSAVLPYYQGENEEQVARAFCERYNVDVDNVPFLVDEIRRQVANL